MGRPIDIRFYGVMVSTQDSESCDPSSNLGRTYIEFFLFFFSFNTNCQHPDTGLVESFPMLSGPVAQRIRHLTTNQGIAGSSPARVNCLFCPKVITSFWLGMFWGFVTFRKISRVKIRKNYNAPPGGLEPPTFRLTAERASRLRHGGCTGRPANLARSPLSIGMANAGFPHYLGMCTLYTALLPPFPF